MHRLTWITTALNRVLKIEDVTTPHSDATDVLKITVQGFLMPITVDRFRGAISIVSSNEDVLV